MSAQATDAEAVLDRLREAIVELGPEPEQITMDATFESLDLDSLDLVELREILGEEFEVKIERADLMELRSVGDVVNFVLTRLA